MLLGAFVLCGIKIDTGERDARYEERVPYHSSNRHS